MHTADSRLLHDFPDQNAFDAKMQAADRRRSEERRVGKEC